MDLVMINWCFFKCRDGVCQLTERILCGWGLVVDAFQGIPQSGKVTALKPRIFSIVSFLRSELPPKKSAGIQYDIKLLL